MKKIFSLFVLIGMLGIPALAGADEVLECADDADCPDGMICAIADCKPCPDGAECPACEPMGECYEVYTPEGCETDADCPDDMECVPMPCACACMACEEGEECEPCECPDCPDDGECMPKYDDPPDGWYADECESDADCPAEFKCEEIGYGSCGGATPACPPCTCMACDPDDEECDPEDCECPPCEEEFVEPECTEEIVKVCMFVPEECEADADCADGFECVAQEVCYGMGTSCACPEIVCACETCPDGEECEPCECPEVPPCDCDDEEEYVEECETLGAYCVPQQITCEDDEGCPEGWECLDFPDDCVCPMCDCAVPPCPEGEECPEPDCDCGPCECEEGGGESYCVPDGWAEAGFESGGSMGSADFLTETANDSTDKGGEENPQSPDPNGEEGGANAEIQAEEGDDGDEGDDDSGCTTGTGNAGPAGLVLLALLALALLATRRFSLVKN